MYASMQSFFIHECALHVPRNNAGWSMRVVLSVVTSARGMLGPACSGAVRKEGTTRMLTY